MCIKICNPYTLSPHMVPSVNMVACKEVQSSYQAVIQFLLYVQSCATSRQGFCSEKGCIRWFCCVNIMECTHTNLNGTACFTPRRHSLAYRSSATSLDSTSLYKTTRDKIKHMSKIMQSRDSVNTDGGGYCWHNTACCFTANFFFVSRKSTLWVMITISTVNT